MIAAAENLPIVVPGWEDSTMGKYYYIGYCVLKEI